MKVSEDYAGKTMSAKWLAAILKDHDTRELVATIESVRKHQFDPKESAKYVLSFVGKEMEAVVNKTNAFALANDLSDDTDVWPGNHVAMSVSWGQTPNGMGHIMHMRGVLVASQLAEQVPQVPSPQGNGGGNAYAAASQPATSTQPRTPQPDSSSAVLLDDEISFAPEWRG